MPVCNDLVPRSGNDKWSKLGIAAAEFKKPFEALQVESARLHF